MVLVFVKYKREEQTCETAYHLPIVPRVGDELQLDLYDLERSVVGKVTKVILRGSNSHPTDNSITVELQEEGWQES